MAKDFVPAKDGELLVWVNGFSSKITATPTAYGLVATQCTALAALVAPFAAAQAAAADLGTRTRAKVAARDAAKKPMVAMVRDLARIINAFPGITNEKRIELGLNPRSGTITPVGVPTESPVMQVLQTNEGRILKVRLSGQDTTRRGKPANCSGASIFSYVSPNGQPPADISLYKFEGSTSRTIFDLEVPPTVPGGSQIFLVSFWFNNKMQSGPACNPVGAFVGGGVANNAAPQALKMAA